MVHWLEKGKPPEKAGRKANGLPTGFRYMAAGLPGVFSFSPMLKDARRRGATVDAGNTYNQQTI
jgi:hypothetical protein